jgi:hypothetical protein
MFLKNKNADHFKTLNGIHKNSIQTLCADHYTPEKIKSWLSWRDANFSKAFDSGDVFIYIEKEVILGFGIVKLPKIIHLFTSPDCIHKGVGTALMKEMEQHLIQNGIQISILSSTLNAEKFYTKHEYIKTEQKIIEPLGGIEISVMEKMLNNPRHYALGNTDISGTEV